MSCNLSKMNFSLANNRISNSNPTNNIISSRSSNPSSLLLVSSRFSLYNNIYTPKGTGCGSCGKK